jgi:hypothetical protein
MKQSYIYIYITYAFIVNPAHLTAHTQHPVHLTPHTQHAHLTRSLLLCY